MRRAVEWEGCLNVRYLGGVALEDGRETRSGVVYRADDVRRLTEAGRRSLAGHGVTRIVDLRWQAERDEDPPGERAYLRGGGLDDGRIRRLKELIAAPRA